MKSQGGFAAIEIILVILIISLLATVALPNMAKMVDVAAVDYEMKIFLSTLDFAKASNKNSHYKTSIFADKLALDAGHELQINVDENLNRYIITKNGEIFSEPHDLPNGFSIICESGMSKQIDPNKKYSGHIRINSSQNINRYVISDSAGRWRGSLTPP